VSTPLGSEEDFAFKHMRKNQYEEELFKCEDQRFELDMVIETNKAAIRVSGAVRCRRVGAARKARRLQVFQPLVSEIAELKEAAASGGFPINRCQFKLDHRGLSTIHFAAIARVYGEHGDDILALLQKNPIGAIPVIHRRLEQKDCEWRKVFPPCRRSCSTDPRHGGLGLAADSTGDEPAVAPDLRAEFFEGSGPPARHVQTKGPASLFRAAVVERNHGVGRRP
jgi:hypothetical protein